MAWSASPARYESSDREAAVLLATRLETGVANWRDTEAVRKAVTGWVESSLANADADGREVFVAHAGEDVVGLVTVCERPHFTGEVEAYVAELVVHANHERRGVGTLVPFSAVRCTRSVPRVRMALTGRCSVPPAQRGH